MKKPKKKRVEQRSKKIKPKKITHKVTKVKSVAKKAVTRPRRKVVAKKIISQTAPLKGVTITESAIVIPLAKEETPAVKKEEIPVIRKEEQPPVIIKEETPLAAKLPVKELTPEIKPPFEVALKEVELEIPINVKDLAIRLQEKPSHLIKILMDMGIMVGINQILDPTTIEKVCAKLGFKIKKAVSKEELVLQIHKVMDKPEDLRPRSPIVTLMGHVDHGKTSLLDAIRKTHVAEREHGGITQHIGAYRVSLPQGEITFLDTPGHEAFTAMRARGASITDIVVLVVAADEGVMPQTQEAIDHARQAGVPIIVAINKIDKPQANIERVKRQLSELNLTPEDWGGKTITVGVSAKTQVGIDDLLEMILLEAEMLQLKANPNRPAQGVVIEAKMSKARGPVSTLLIRNGTLHLNENIIVGKYYGKIRAMFDDHGRAVNTAGPSFPVEVLGIAGIPLPGEQFFVVEDERIARELALKRQEEERLAQVRQTRRLTLEELHSQIQQGQLKELKLIIKADVQGSLGAIKETLNKLNISEIKLDIIHEGVGNINASDVILAVASNALILGFNVTIDERAKELNAKEGVDIRIYNIIYELANDIKAAIEGMLEPRLKKVFLGRAEIRKVFKLSKAGTVAGCFVLKGKINRNSAVKVIRNGEVVFEGKISSLKRFKDDVREVQEGFECGIALSGFDAIKEGDIIETYEIEKIARKL
ncbi:MAG: translation initiation factor IF-2 [Candidatus Omnitrophica bacterium]|nr:translation initiation factor IF-2 [Candidatus Omnitrophota bacterium]